MQSGEGASPRKRLPKKKQKKGKKTFVSVKKNLRKIVAAIKNILICHCGL